MCLKFVLGHRYTISARLNVDASGCSYLCVQPPPAGPISKAVHRSRANLVRHLHSEVVALRGIHGQ